MKFIINVFKSHKGYLYSMLFLALAVVLNAYFLAKIALAAYIPLVDKAPGNVLTSSDWNEVLKVINIFREFPTRTIPAWTTTGGSVEYPQSNQRMPLITPGIRWGADNDAAYHAYDSWGDAYAINIQLANAGVAPYCPSGFVGIKTDIYRCGGSDWSCVSYMICF